MAEADELFSMHKDRETLSLTKIPFNSKGLDLISIYLTFFFLA